MSLNFQKVNLKIRILFLSALYLAEILNFPVILWFRTEVVTEIVVFIQPNHLIFYNFKQFLFISDTTYLHYFQNSRKHQVFAM